MGRYIVKKNLYGCRLLLGHIIFVFYIQILYTINTEIYVQIPEFDVCTTFNIYRFHNNAKSLLNGSFLYKKKKTYLQEKNL